MPQSPDQTHTGQTPESLSHAPLQRATVAEQLAEVYVLVDELHEMTDRIKAKVDSVLKRVNDAPSQGDTSD